MASAASAQEEDEIIDTAPPEADTAAEGEALGDPETDEAADVVDSAKVTDDASMEATDIQQRVEPNLELEGKTYYFIGARYRAIVVPQFMINIFGVDGGKSVVVHSFGPEFGIRKDNFEYNLSLWYADYSMDKTPFKGSSDPIQAWEHVESDMQMIAFTTDFLWTAALTPEFGINYGLGAGVGIPFGDLNRYEVKPPGGDESAPKEDWELCTSPDGGFCEKGGVNPEENWFNGGSKPTIFPWFALQTGLRFKPDPRFVARLDLGFGTSGFFVGLGADYGL